MRPGPSASAGDVIADAVGFSPAASSIGKGWRSAGLFAWRGYAEECRFPLLDEPVVVFHTGGAQTVPMLNGARLHAASHPGLFTVIPPATPITWQIAGEVHSYTVHLGDKCFDRLVDDDADRLIDQLELRCAFPDHLLGGMVEALASEIARPSQIGSLYVDALADTMALHVLRSPSRPAPNMKRSGMSDHALKRITDRIEDCLEAGISLQDLATDAGMSRAQFASAFRQATGLSPHRYLTERRLSAARTMLRNTRRAIADIALDCGFSSQAHFTEYFRRTSGFTPAVYRRINLDGARAVEHCLD